MISGGDEFGRTQSGNNNSYCQDNEVNWYSWTRNESQKKLLDFTCKLIAFRQEHPIFHRPKFFKGKPILENLKDINWNCPDGREMTEKDWNDPKTHSLGILLCGDDMGVKTFEGHVLTDDTFYLCFNAHFENVDFKLPGKPEVNWRLIFDTSLEEGFLAEERIVKSGSIASVAGRAMCLFQQAVGSDDQAKGSL